jgi:purine-binding chemotaxis protein CheW
MANPTNDTTSVSQFVTFGVGGEEFAVPILAVREIIRWVAPTPIPCSPPGVDGVINLRGEIIPVARMNTRLGLDETEHLDPEDRRIVVLDLPGHNVGFLVDNVRRVVSIKNDQVSPPPRMGSAVSNDLAGVAKLDDRLVMIIDPARLMTGDITQAVEQATTAERPRAAAA